MKERDISERIKREGRESERQSREAKEEKTRSSLCPLISLEGMREYAESRTENRSTEREKTVECSWASHSEVTRSCFYSKHLNYAGVGEKGRRGFLFVSCVFYWN